ncbi:MAG: type I methionyl aminopeptidase [Patescibacteria group bacterium]
MITKKSPEEIEVLREAGSILAKILKGIAKEAVPGVTTLDLDDVAQQLAEQHEVEPILLGYHPSFAPTPYPAATCLSVNEVVQHGIPNDHTVLAEGDIINIDMSIGHKDMVVDSGITVGVGEISKDAQKLIDVTREARAIGVKAAQPGNHIGDISHAVQKFVESKGFSVVEALAGHGVGYSVHEEPTIPNFGRPGEGPLIEVGHVYAIEPIVNIGKPDVIFDDDGDGYTVTTKDGSLSAQFEHTVAITENGPEPLTI